MHALLRSLQIATLFTGLVKGQLQHGLLRGLENRLRAIDGYVKKRSSYIEKEDGSTSLELRNIDREWRGALSIDKLSEKPKNLYPFLIYSLCGLITPAIVTAFSPTSVHHKLPYDPVIPDSMFGKSEIVNGSMVPCVGIVKSGDSSNLYWQLDNGSYFYGASSNCPPSQMMSLAPNINTKTPDDYAYADSGVAVEREAIGAPASIYDGSALHEFTTTYGTALQRTTQCVPVMATNPVRCQIGGNVTVLTDLSLSPEPSLNMQVFGPYGQFPNNIFNRTSAYPYRNLTKDSAMVSFIYSMSDELRRADSVGETILGFGAYTDPAGKTTYASTLARTMNDPNKTVGLAGKSTYAISCTIQPRSSFEYRKLTLDIQGVAKGNSSNLAWRLSGGDKCTPVNATISNIHFVTAAMSPSDLVMERTGFDGYFATLINIAGFDRGPPYAFANSRNSLEDTLGLIAAMGVSRIPIKYGGGIVANATAGGGGPAFAVIKVTRLGGDTGGVLVLLIPPLASFLALASIFLLSFRSNWRIGGSEYKDIPANQRPMKYAAESICELVALNHAHGHVSVSENGTIKSTSQCSVHSAVILNTSMRSHMS